MRLWLLALVLAACGPLPTTGRSNAPPLSSNTSTSSGKRRGAEAVRCRQLDDHSVRLRVDACTDLQRGPVGMVTGGTEEQLVQCARWCEHHHGLRPSWRP